MRHAGDDWMSDRLLKCTRGGGVGVWGRWQRVWAVCGVGGARIQQGRGQTCYANKVRTECLASTWRVPGERNRCNSCSGGRLWTMIGQSVGCCYYGAASLSCFHHRYKTNRQVRPSLTAPQPLQDQASCIRRRSSYSRSITSTGFTPSLPSPASCPPRHPPRPGPGSLLVVPHYAHQCLRQL